MTTDAEAGGPLRPLLRLEKAADAPAVRALLIDGYGGETEADLLDRLRDDGALAFALIAEHETAVIGVVGFSAAPIDADGRRIQALALAPLAVDRRFWSRGVGTALARAGLIQGRKRGFEVVLALGRPRFYERVGFSVAAARGVETPWSGPSFLAAPLVDALPRLAGPARYPAAFGAAA